MLLALKHFRDSHKLVFDSLSPFNEPGSPAWISGIAMQECCYFNHRRMNDVGRGRGWQIWDGGMGFTEQHDRAGCAAFRRWTRYSQLSPPVPRPLHPPRPAPNRTKPHPHPPQVIRELDTRKEELGNTLVVAHEQFCISDAAKDAAKTGKKIWPMIGRVNTHTYDSSEFLGEKAPWFVVKLQDNRFKREGLRRSVARAGKPLWVSEFGTGKGAAGLATHILVSGLGCFRCVIRGPVLHAAL